MTMRKTLALTLLILLCLARSNAQIPVIDENKNDKVEQRVLSKVKNLSEVRAFFKDCQKENKPSLLVNRVPDSTFKYYWIAIGISNFDQFRASYHLYINPKTSQVYYLDFMDRTGNGLVPLRQWRRLRNDPKFHDLHKIRNGRLVPTNEII